jgi:hypothetical protein
LSASIAVLTACFLIGVPHPRGPVPPTTAPTRPPVKLTPSHGTPPPKTPTRATPPPGHAMPVPPRLPTPVEVESGVPVDGEVPPLPTTIVKRYRPAPDRITLPQLLELLTTRSPRHLASQAEIDVAESEAKAANVLPNPILNLAILYLNSGFNQNGVGTYYANVTLPLLIAGQRRMRVKAARAGVDVAKGTVKREFETLATAARTLFVELQADQARLDTIAGVLEELDQLQKLIDARRGAGVQSKYEQVWTAIDRASWRTRRAEGLDLARREEAFSHRNIELAQREAWPVPAITAGTVVIQNYFSVSTTVGITVPVPTFDWAGFPVPLADRIVGLRDGLVIVAGATGSGKTTTLAMIVNRLHKAGGQRIITVEEPIEYRFARAANSVVTQREVGRDVPTFADGLKYGLRQDPDVILVGEIRDRETAQMALSAAETGHLVLTTLHTRDAKGAVTRFADLFPQDAQRDVRGQLAMKGTSAPPSSMSPFEPASGLPWTVERSA